MIIDNFRAFNIQQVYKKGVLMVDHGEVRGFPAPEIEPYLVERAHKTFHVAALTAEDFAEKRPRGVIGMVDGEAVHIDATWGDQGTAAAAQYFAMTPQQSYALHPWPRSNELPG